MKVAAVILNYNDADETIEAVRRIAGFASLSTIIVVDNASTDGSAERLKGWLREENHRFLAEEEQEDDDDDDEAEQLHRYMLVKAEKNGGYGSGNNLGVQYAYEIAGADLVLIANPDAVFTEDCLRKVITCFEDEPNAAIVSVPSEGRGGRPEWQLSAWPLRSFFGELFHGGPLLRRVLRHWLEYPEKMFSGKAPVRVDVVHGAFLMVDADRFMACGGFDENVFLYGEENILAFKTQDNGSKTMLLTDCTYRHKGSGTISASYNAVERQKLRQTSELYYFKHYLEISPAEQALAVLFQKLVLFETKLFLQ